MSRSRRNSRASGAPDSQGDLAAGALVLASASPRRIELLARWGVDCRVVPATGVDESHVTGDARTVAETLAAAKARWTHRRLVDDGEEITRLRVIGADTVVALDGDVLGKPADATDARRMLRRLSGRTHEVITGVAVITPPGRITVESESSPVRFRELEDSEIDAYVASGAAQGKAGAYGIQDAGAALIAGFEGCYYTIVGLPMRRTLRLLGIECDCDCATHPLCRGGEGCRRES